ncbi:MAG TPA: hypothetical protein VGG85_17180 [Terracidiphilus sp.]|jgi:hypothetical protein
MGLSGPALPNPRFFRRLESIPVSEIPCIHRPFRVLVSQAAFLSPAGVNFGIANPRYPCPFHALLPQARAENAKKEAKKRCLFGDVICDLSKTKK